MNLKNVVLIFLFTVISLSFTACMNPLCENADDLNLVYNDHFTLISRTKVSNTLTCSIYSTETLKKNVTVYVRGNWKESSWYSNYDALKYENECNEKLGSFIKDELFLKDDEYEVSFDNKFYTTAYQSQSFEAFYRERLIWSEGDQFPAPDVINDETIYITIKESAVTIRKDVYVKVVEKVLNQTQLSSRMKVTFVNANGEKVDEYEFKN